MSSTELDVARQLKKKKNLWVTPQQDTALKRLELRTGMSQSEHMRRALDAYFNVLKGEGIGDFKLYTS